MYEVFEKVVGMVEFNNSISGPAAVRRNLFHIRPFWVTHYPDSVEGCRKIYFGPTARAPHPRRKRIFVLLIAGAPNTHAIFAPRRRRTSPIKKVPEVQNLGRRTI